MTPLVWQRLDAIARSATPSLAVLMLVLVSVTPLPIRAYGAVAPLLPMIGIYYWAIYRPDLLPFVVVFLAGLLLDLLTGAPLGVHSFAFLLCHGLVFTQRHFMVGRSFVALWCGFVVVQLLASLLEWVVFSLYSGAALRLSPALFSGLITIALFPLFAWLLMQVQRGFLRPA